MRTVLRIQPDKEGGGTSPTCTTLHSWSLTISPTNSFTLPSYSQCLWSLTQTL